MDSFKLPEKFLLGTATSSLQIEGGDKNNSWYEWCEAGHIKDKSSCYTACDHWNRVRQDTEILKSLNVQTHRMSLEWSRIEPSAGKFSQSAVEHYRNELKLLIDSNIQPLVTLHHFSEPIWFINKGGWTKSENSKFFIEYVKFTVEKLGDLVCQWVTFNEPNVYAFFGYALGSFPPGIHNLLSCRRVVSELIKTHTEIYDMIHKIRSQKKFDGETKVGAAIHIRIFDGITFLGKITACAADYIFNRLCEEGMTKRKILFPLSKKGFKNKASKKFCADFFGINYYTRNVIEFALDPSNYFHKMIGDDDLNKNDLGWDIYPFGIFRAAKKYYEKYRIPIYITENGISDKHDHKRPAFISEHLFWLGKALKAGINVERYYHWTVMDNFEWLEGENGNFGLYRCNFKTQQRDARKSAELYSLLCQNKELNAEMMRKFNIF